jgi:prevent-host-death family protein
LARQAPVDDLAGDDPAGDDGERPVGHGEAASANTRRARGLTMEAASRPVQFNVHEAKTHFSRILERVATGEEVVISKAGEPVAKVVPLRPKVQRTERGSLRGRIHIPDDFDELPDDLSDAFGMR